MVMQKWWFSIEFQDCEENNIFLEKLFKFYMVSTEISLVYK